MRTQIVQIQRFGFSIPYSVSCCVCVESFRWLFLNRAVQRSKRHPAARRDGRDMKREAVKKNVLLCSFIDHALVIFRLFAASLYTKIPYVNLFRGSVFVGRAGASLRKFQTIISAQKQYERHLSQTRFVGSVMPKNACVFCGRQRGVIFRQCVLLARQKILLSATSSFVRYQSACCPMRVVRFELYIQF